MGAGIGAAAPVVSCDSSSGLSRLRPVSEANALSTRRGEPRREHPGREGRRNGPRTARGLDHIFKRACGMGLQTPVYTLA